MVRLFEADLHVIAQVGATLRATALTASATGELLENIPKDVGEPAEILRSTAPTILESSFAIAVISRPLLRVFQNIIGLTDGLEPRLGVLAPRIFVGMKTHRKLAVR
jgi:hypothetical protein